MKANFHQLYPNLIEVNWLFLHDYYCVYEACQAFYQKLDEICWANVPQQTRKNCDYPARYTTTIINSITKEGKLLEKHEKWNCQSNHEQFRDIRNIIKKRLRQYGDILTHNRKILSIATQLNCGHLITPWKIPLAYQIKCVIIVKRWPIHQTLLKHLPVFSRPPS